MFFGCSDNVVSQTGFRSQAISEDRPRQAVMDGDLDAFINAYLKALSHGTLKAASAGGDD